MEKKLVIYGSLSGLNEYTKACRTNPFVGSRMKKSNEAIINLAILKQLKGVIFNGRVWLDFKWYEKNKRRDFDNICFAKKFILDSLVTTGIIEADSWKGIEGFTDTFAVDKGNPRIEVLIKGECYEQIPNTKG